MNMNEPPLQLTNNKLLIINCLRHLFKENKRWQFMEVVEDCIKQIKICVPDINKISQFQFLIQINSPCKFDFFRNLYRINHHSLYQDQEANFLSLNLSPAEHFSSTSQSPVQLGFQVNSFVTQHYNSKIFFHYLLFHRFSQVCIEYNNKFNLSYPYFQLIHPPVKCKCLGFLTPRELGFKFNPLGL